MSHPDQNHPGRVPAPQIDCERAGRCIQVLLSGELSALAQSALARHRRECDECDASYLRQVDFSAKQLQAGSHERRSHPRPRHTSVWVPLLHRRRLLALRFLLVCAMVFAVTRLIGGFDGDPTLYVERVAGGVWVGGYELTEEEPSVQAWRSDLVQTDEGGRARLQVREIELVLEPQSDLLIESAWAQRSRLLAGSLVARGELDVHTPHGVVRLGPDSSARIAVVGRSLEVESRAGAVAWVSALGVRELAPGEHLRGGAGLAIEEVSALETGVAGSAQRLR